MSAKVPPRPGFYPDPADPRVNRWWNGVSWSEAVQRPAEEGLDDAATVDGSTFDVTSGQGEVPASPSAFVFSLLGPWKGHLASREARMVFFTLVGLFFFGVVVPVSGVLVSLLVSQYPQLYSPPGGGYVDQGGPLEEYPTEEYPTEEYPTEEYPTEEYPTEEYPVRNLWGGEKFELAVPGSVTPAGQWLTYEHDDGADVSTLAVRVEAVWPVEEYIRLQLVEQNPRLVDFEFSYVLFSHLNVSGIAPTSGDYMRDFVADGPGVRVSAPPESPCMPAFFPADARMGDLIPQCWYMATPAGSSLGNVMYTPAPGPYENNPAWLSLPEPMR
jgi:hypothetical protein